MIRVALRALALALSGLASGACAADAAETAVRAGGSFATVATDAPYVRFSGGMTLDTAGIPEVRTAAGTPVRGRGVPALTARDSGSASLTFPTGDALLPAVRLTVHAAGDGIFAVALTAPPVPGSPAPQRAELGFGTVPQERFLGFGERSNAVDQRGGDVQNLVTDGAYPPRDQAAAQAVVPPWGFSGRADATNFPVPWLLSTRGYGVLVDGAATSGFDLSGPSHWTVGDEAATLALHIFAGPTPADALARFTRFTGRQPPPSAPLAYGPWFQTGQANTIPLATERAATAAQRAARVPVSVAETQMHYLPCGAQRGNEAYEAARAAAFHAAGLSEFVYLNPLLCVSYANVYARAVAVRALQEKAPGIPFTFTGFVGGTAGLGFSVQPLANVDFTRPGTAAFFTPLMREIVAAGHDGWMEDFGEYGEPGPTHNSYPTAYHCALQRITAELSAKVRRPLTRFSRSGWTGTAPCVDDVWGGDNTTVWGFDGLRSVVREGLTMGLSGISRWGSDIGGYDSFGPSEQLGRELLARWIEVGAVSGVMRTKGGGLAIPAYGRPQVWEPPTLPVWTRYTQLRVALLPYIEAADADYRATGLPIMRHLALVAPGDAAATREDDAFGFGPSLLAAPVLHPGARVRTVHLPPGRWVDLWRSWLLDPATGAIRLTRARKVTGDVTVPTPLDELPLFARAGTMLTLLTPGIDTLSPYGGPGLVHLRDREDSRAIVGWPRGTARAAFGDAGESIVTTERSRGRRALTIAVRGNRKRTYAMQLSLTVLKRPFVPRQATVRNGRLLRWRYNPGTHVLSLTVRGHRPTAVLAAT